MVQVNFYKPTAYVGWKRLLWWIISLFSRRYIHCDFTVGDQVVLADGFTGGVWVAPAAGRAAPSVSFALDVNGTLFMEVSKEFIGQDYGWLELVKAGLPFVPSKPDEPGIICSEHVAKTLIRLSERTGTMQVLRAKLEAMKPSGSTPRQVYDVVSSELRKI